MDGLIEMIFSDPTVLTPTSILEFFVFVGILEFLGMMFSWTKGGR